MANILSDKINMRAEYLEFIGTQQSQYLRTAGDFLDEIIGRRDGVDGAMLPWHAPWLRFRPKEVTIWAGYNYHGKSLVAGMVTAWMMRQHPCVIASLEMPAASTLDRMIAQCAGRKDYSEQYVRQWAGETANQLWLYDVQGKVTAEDLLGLCCYSAKHLHAQHVWIDSLMQVAHSGKDAEKFSRQSDFVQACADIARRLAIHIHIIAHLKKPDGVYAEETMPDRYAIAGLGDLSNRVDNCVIVHSNKAKARMLRMHESGEKALDDEKLRYVQGRPDMRLNVDKQRHARGPGTGVIELWAHDSGQFVERDPLRGNALIRLEWR